MSKTDTAGTHKAAYLKLYCEIRDGILSGRHPYGSRLPSKRQLASDYEISVITVEHAMILLADEGYIESRERSGYYVTYKEKDSFAVGSPEKIGEFPTDISPATLSELEGFSFSVYARTMRRVLSDYGEAILVKSPNKGTIELRSAISSYLSRSRGIYADPEQIIIGSGAEYLYGLVVQILGRNRKYGIENPSYAKIEQVYRTNDVDIALLSLGEEGILSRELEKTDADILHITPYRSYPSGVTASASKRREYLRWAQQRDGRIIVEDDFESEFTPSAKPAETVFSLSGDENVIYLNTFSKTMAPAIRIGYMVLPKSLLSVYEKRAGFFSCAVPAYDQYVLARFIENGDFERHINRVRRRNRSRQKALTDR